MQEFVQYQNMSHWISCQGILLSFLFNSVDEIGSHWLIIPLPKHWCVNGKLEKPKKKKKNPEKPPVSEISDKFCDYSVHQMACW